MRCARRSRRSRRSRRRCSRASTRSATSCRRRPADGSARRRWSTSTFDIAGVPTQRHGRPRRSRSIEISDYHCPFCRRHVAADAAADRRGATSNTGKVRYVFVDYPIAQLHPDAFKSHEAASCAGDQGKYWEMHAKLFDDAAARRAEQLTGAGAGRRARRDGVPRLPRAAASTRRKCRRASSAWRKLDVDGTPMFLDRPDAAARPADQGRQGGRGRAAVRGVQDGDRRSCSTQAHADRSHVHDRPQPPRARAGTAST